MKDTTIVALLAAIKWANKHGLAYEFLKYFLEHATCDSHTGDQEIFEAIAYANREWDL